MSEDTGTPQKESKVQVNVRLPESLRDRIDERRGQLGLSRDQWMQNAAELALRQPPGTLVRRPGARRPAVLRGGTRRAGQGSDSSST